MQGNDQGDEKRVVVKKIKVTPEPGAPRQGEPEAPPRSVQRTLAKGPAAVTNAPQAQSAPPPTQRTPQPQQGAAAPTAAQPSAQQGAQSPSPVVKKTVVKKTVAAEGEQPKAAAPAQGAAPAPQGAPAPGAAPPQGTPPARQGEPPRVEMRRVEKVVVREKPPAPAPPSPERLESGFNYLVEEPQPRRSFEFFEAKVAQGAKGLCISTSYPKKIIEEYGLHGSTVYWLSELEFDNQSLHPRRLDFEVTRAIQNFVKSNPSSVLIIDGVEFLILINGFERVMTFIKKMNDIMSATASTLITSINPSAFSEEKLSIIEREFDRVLKYAN